MTFFAELKRRNVFRVGIAYLVASWLLIQITDIIFPRIGLPDSAVTLVIALLGIGFIPALILAWAFELTPGGIVREKNVDPQQSITTRTGRKIDLTIIGILVVILVYFIADKFILQPDAGASNEPVVVESTEAAVVEDIGPSVAVLPFINMSSDKDNEYFSDGLTETLLHMLAQLPGLHVAARTSSFAFKGQNTSITEIAAALGVAHILEGSVQKAGQRVRITAQLIRAEDGFHVWSQNYDRTLDDIFAIQDEIATDVAGALDASLLNGANNSQVMHGVETSNVVAYESYLKGLEQQGIGSYSSLEMAENHFKQAFARDSGFVEARLALVRNYLMMIDTGLLTDEETSSRIESLIQQVREQAPDNRLAHAFEIIAKLQRNQGLHTRQQIEPMVTELVNLLEQLPTETYIRLRVVWYLNFFLKQIEQALALIEAGLVVDPLDAELYNIRGLVYQDQKRNAEALIALQKSQQLAPDNPISYQSLARLEADNNNLVAALEWHRQATEVDPQDHELAADIANILYKLKLPEEGDLWYARVIALAPGSPVAKHVEIHRFIARNEQDKALMLATSMISGQIENRRGAFAEAMFTYVGAMMDSGKYTEAYDFLSSVSPEITNYAELPTDINTMMMQWSSIVLMTGFASDEDHKDAWLKFVENLDKAGIRILWLEPDSYSFILDKLFTGDLDAATNALLERLNQPLATHLEAYLPFHQLMLADIYADPRVANRMAELGKEHAQLRKQVSALMLEPEWNQ
ncbi:MAG: tetratricopeptide repeat protein [Proteobacteria bacterium]|nr:tetratricopeptide repeat protein [Pseudomonadota bacterium]